MEGHGKRCRQWLGEHWQESDLRSRTEAFIHSQRHEGWVVLPEKYDDGGFSGGNMERPALRRLLADVEVRKVYAIVVYKVDRLSRNLSARSLANGCGTK